MEEVEVGRRDQALAATAPTSRLSTAGRPRHAVHFLSWISELRMGSTATALVP